MERERGGREGGREGGAYLVCRRWGRSAVAGRSHCCGWGRTHHHRHPEGGEGGMEGGLVSEKDSGGIVKKRCADTKPLSLPPSLPPSLPTCCLPPLSLGLSPLSSASLTIIGRETPSRGVLCKARMAGEGGREGGREGQVSCQQQKPFLSPLSLPPSLPPFLHVPSAASCLVLYCTKAMPRNLPGREGGREGGEVNK